jgi:hypothetical protein
MKQIIIILLISFIAPHSFGQFYIQPSVGYSFSSHPAENQSTLIVENQKTVYTTKLNYGEGMHLDLNLGYGFMDNFFIELNAMKSIYSKSNVSTVQPDLQSLDNFSASGYFGKINIESSIFQMAPLIGYKVQKKKFSTYFKFGPNFMKSTVDQSFEYIDWKFEDWEFYPLNTVRKYEISGKFHVGLQANLGFCYSIKQNLQFVLDFVTVYNNYKIKKAEIKSYEVDGVSQLNTLDDTNIEIDKDDNRRNHSYYGLNIGVRYLLNKKE